jgi:hypothetical protein
MTSTNDLATEQMQQEHGALIRQIADLQVRVGRQIQTCQQQVTRLEQALLNARAQLMIVRTALLWGLAGASGPWAPGHQGGRPTRATPPASPLPMKEADAAICQTGCMGHAHPWLDDDGQCRRTGQPCEHVAEGAGKQAKGR